MSNKYTEAQARASKKYQQERAQLKITITKEQRERYRRIAESRGLSMTGLIVELLEDLE